MEICCPRLRPTARSGLHREHKDSDGESDMMARRTIQVSTREGV